MLGEVREKLSKFFLRTSFFLSVILFCLWPISFLPVVNGQFVVWSQYLPVLLVLLSATFFVLFNFLKGHIVFEKNILDWPILLLIIVVFFSSIISANIYEAFFSSFGLVTWLAGFFIYKVTIKNFKDLNFKSKKVICGVWLFFMYLLFIFSGALLYVFIAGDTQNGNLLLKAGIDLGGLEKLSLYITAASLFVFGYIALVDSKMITFQRLLFIDIFFAMSVVLQLTINYRLAWLGNILGGLFIVNLYFWKIRANKERFSFRRIIWPTLFILLSAIILLLPSSSLPDSLNGLNRQLPHQANLSFSAGYDIVKQEIASKPFWGDGPGGFGVVFSKFRPQSLNNSDLWQIRFNQAPSFVWQILAEIGVIGLISYILILLLGVYIAFILFIDSRNQNNVFYGGSLACLLFGFIYWQFVFCFDIWTLLVFFLVLGVLVNLLIKKENDVGFVTSELSFDGLKAVLINLLLLIFVVCLLVITFQHFVSEIFFTKGNMHSVEKATSLNESKSFYKVRLSNIYAQQAFDFYNNGQITQANQKLEQAIKLAEIAAYALPRSVVANENVAMIYRDSGYFVQGGIESSIKWFEKSLNLEPSNPVLASELGKAFEQNNQFDEAEKYLTLALALKSDYYDAKFALAKLYVKQNKEKESLKILEELESLVDDPEVFYEDGRLSYNVGEYGRATKKFLAVINISPTNVNALYSLGLSYEMMGNETDSQYYFQRALLYDSENLEIRSKVKIKR